MNKLYNWVTVFAIILLTGGILGSLSAIGDGGLFIVLILAAIICFICSYMIGRNAEEIAERKERVLRCELDQILKAKEAEISNRENRLIEKEDNMNKRLSNVDNIMKSSMPFVLSSSLVTDMECYIYDKIADELTSKQRPAIKAAEEVKRLKRYTKEFLLESKKINYRLETLLEIFPELEGYIDNDEGLLSLNDFDTISEFEDNRDKVSDYISKEEYLSLSVDERNQLALDRYMNRPRSSWQIGVEYEMYIEYLLREKGYTTIPFGSRMGLKDLGRDIIAQKVVDNKLVTYIIQCKNWSEKKNKEVHENVVCQTYGTAMEYEISTENNEIVIPVIVSTVPLSDMAKKFADRLGVKYNTVPHGRPPLIKCNISSSGEKIYHLPFDQQYFRTDISKKGEFYAMTVKEASSQGFRRAQRHFVGE